MRAERKRGETRDAGKERTRREEEGGRGERGGERAEEGTMTLALMSSTPLPFFVAKIFSAWHPCSGSASTHGVSHMWRDIGVDLLELRVRDPPLVLVLDLRADLEVTARTSRGRGCGLGQGGREGLPLCAQPIAYSSNLRSDAQIRTNRSTPHQGSRATGHGAVSLKGHLGEREVDVGRGDLRVNDFSVLAELRKRLAIKCLLPSAVALENSCTVAHFVE
eukprot:3601013-Rhodomonas_salina.4